MKIIIRCPRCRRDVAIDRDDQLPLPAPPPPPQPNNEVFRLRDLVKRHREKLTEQAERIRILTSENEGLRANVYDRHATPAEKWRSVAGSRQTEINRLKAKNRELQTTLNEIKPQAAAKFFDAQNSEEGYLVLNGNAASAFPDINY